MRSRPFSESPPPVAPYERRLTITAGLRARSLVVEAASDAPRAPQLHAAEAGLFVPELVARFVRAVNAGCFARARPGGAAALTMQLDTSNSETLRYHLDVALPAVSPAAFRALFNSADYSVLCGSRLRSLVVTEDAQSEARLTETTAIEPLTRTSLPFAYSNTHENAQISAKSLGLEVKFAAPPTERVIDALAESVDAWCGIVAAGAFDRFSTCHFLDLSRFSRSRFVAIVEDCACGVEGWSALLTSICNIHDSGSSVELVQVGGEDAL